MILAREDCTAAKVALSDLLKYTAGSLESPACSAPALSHHTLDVSYSTY